MTLEAPSMPETESEWAAHWAFYSLTVQQRDSAWETLRILGRELDEVIKKFDDLEVENERLKRRVNTRTVVHPRRAT